MGARLLKSAPNIRFKCVIAMVFLREWGLGGVIKKVKILEIHYVLPLFQD